MTCANCSGPISQTKPHLYDEHTELTFCDAQCWHEWATDEGEDVVLAFYKRMNVEAVTP